jgi:uncharacterized membrane protein (DUF373 family)
MTVMQEILRHYDFDRSDEANIARLAELLLPGAGELSEAFYAHLSADPQTAAYFRNEAAISRRKETLQSWFRDLLTARYDDRYLQRLQRIGRVHVEIGLPGHLVNASMNFLRRNCHRRLEELVTDEAERSTLAATLDKILDINLDVMTSSYRQAELNKYFLSQRMESAIIRFAERLMHGLNLLLVIGLLVMAAGITALFAHDVVQAFAGPLDAGVVKALGSLLILWMMIELLHAEVRYLKGGRFNLRVFLELALVAFIRKLFVAALEKTEPVAFGLLLGGLLVLGLLFAIIGRSESGQQG